MQPSWKCVEGSGTVWNLSLWKCLEASLSGSVSKLLSPEATVVSRLFLGLLLGSVVSVRWAHNLLVCKRRRELTGCVTVSKVKEAKRKVELIFWRVKKR
jgi:hypothetical protein